MSLHIWGAGAKTGSSCLQRQHFGQSLAGSPEQRLIQAADKGGATAACQLQLKGWTRRTERGYRTYYNSQGGAERFAAVWTSTVSYKRWLTIACRDRSIVDHHLQEHACYTLVGQAACEVSGASCCELHFCRRSSDVCQQHSIFCSFAGVAGQLCHVVLPWCPLEHLHWAVQSYSRSAGLPGL